MSFKEKSGPEGAEPKYNCTILVNQEDKDTIATLQSGFDEAVAEGKKKGLWKASPKKLIDLLQDKSEDYEAEFWQGVLAFRAKTIHPVNIIGPDGKSVPPDKCYDGMNAKVCVTFYPYSHPSGGKGIGVQLNSVLALNGGEKIVLQYDVKNDFQDDFKGIKK